MTKTTKMKVGKFQVTVHELNEPSEEAIMRCRKTVTKIMNERIHNEQNI